MNKSHLILKSFALVLLTSCGLMDAKAKKFDVKASEALGDVRGRILTNVSSIVTTAPPLSALVSYSVIHRVQGFLLQTFNFPPFGIVPNVFVVNSDNGGFNAGYNAQVQSVLGIPALFATQIITITHVQFDCPFLDIPSVVLNGELTSFPVTAPGYPSFFNESALTPVNITPSGFDIFATFVLYGQSAANNQAAYLSELVLGAADFIAQGKIRAHSDK